MKVLSRFNGYRHSCFLGSILCVAVLLAVASGCGSGQKNLAPVSGIITLDGKPLAGGTVFFQPSAPPGSTIAGKGSSGKCDDSGRYQLVTLDDKPGAVVAVHSVAVYGPRGQQARASDDAPVREEIVPRKYNIDTELTLTVPAEGTDQANFDLTSK